MLQVTSQFYIDECAWFHVGTNNSYAAPKFVTSVPGNLLYRYETIMERSMGLESWVLVPVDTNIVSMEHFT